MLSWLPPFPGPSKPSAHLFLAPQPGVGPRRPPFSLAFCCCAPASCWDLYRVLPALALTHVELKAQPLSPIPVFCPHLASLFCGELLALATILGLLLQSGFYRSLQRCPAHPPRQEERTARITGRARTPLSRRPACPGSGPSWDNPRPQGPPLTIHQVQRGL